MNALKMEESEPGLAREGVELIDCGRASERTKGGVLANAFEFNSPPFHWFAPE